MGAAGFLRIRAFRKQNAARKDAIQLGVSFFIIRKYEASFCI